MNAAMPSCRLRVAEQVRHRLRQAPGRVLRHCLAIDSRDGATGVGNRRASGPSTRPTSTIPSRPIRRPEFMPPPGRSSRSRHGREAVQPDRGLCRTFWSRSPRTPAMRCRSGSSPDHPSQTSRRLSSSAGDAPREASGALGALARPVRPRSARPPVARRRRPFSEQSLCLPTS
jgi:hypothetical protein